MRSFLFVPGDSERKLVKASESIADALIVDLEDSIALDSKEHARSLALEFLTSRKDKNGPFTFVRINSFETGQLLEDLATVMKGHPAGIVLPKCQSQANLDLLAHYISALEVREGIERNSTQIIAIATETARSVMNLSHTPLSHQRLTGLLWGAEDLSTDLGAETNRNEKGEYLGIFEHARHICLMAATAVDVIAIDAVYTSISDSKGLADEVRSARRLGFTAKAAIHPDQIKIIHKGLAPSHEQVEWAERVLKAFHTNKQKGVLSLNGQMLDRPHLHRAKRIIQRARNNY